MAMPSLAHGTLSEDAVTPTSHLLSGRLREHREQSKRSRRRTDFGPLRPGFDEDLFLAEAESQGPPTRLRGASPAVSAGRASSRKSSDGDTTGARKMLGIRDMDEKLQKLEKLNFDLKMEIHHLHTIAHKGIFFLNQNILIGSRDARSGNPLLN